jgi:hypothetical protein
MFASSPHRLGFGMVVNEKRNEKEWIGQVEKPNSFFMVN